MQILAKPSGILLNTHVSNVINEGHKIIGCYPFAVEKYRRYTGKSLAERLEGACKFHDEGKKHPRWQTACRRDNQVFLDWQMKYGGSFQEYENVVKNTGKNLMNAHIRHEIDSVVRHPGLPLQIQVAIAAHHGKLSRYHEAKWLDEPFRIEGSTQAWNRFERLNNGYILNPIQDFRKAVRQHYEFAGVRGMLQLADHRASIRENNAFVPDYVRFEYHFPDHWTKRPVQSIAETHWEEDLLLVRAPTGAGKTSAALLWAKKQIEGGRADRLVIAMPTRFTSNALAISVSSSLSETGLYHSSAWFKNFHFRAKESAAARHEARMTHEFARILQTPITICTIDHLLISLTLSREDHHTIVFNLANSCVVIDEADFYDDFTQANILVLLEALNELHVPVMIMSASLPESCLKMYQSTGYQVNEIISDTSDIDRPRCEVSSKREYSSVNDLEDLLVACNEQPTIIYANTVDKAVQFYDWFKKNSDIEPILYHSRFTEPDKLLKEDILLKNLGKEAWKNGTANGVAILTQIGEMSINISADRMISDVCPIDRLVQRAGRLARFNTHKIGKLYILVPIKDGAIYPAPYGFYDRVAKHWVAGRAFSSSLDELQLNRYSANDFIQLINNVYVEIEDFSVSAKENARLLKENFTYNWIILPRAISEIDDTETQFWKSRNIDNQESVLIRFPENPYFINYLDWQAFKIENSVDIPVYLVHQGIKDYKIKQRKIYVNEDPIAVFCVYDGVYTDTKGLHFSKSNTIEDQLLG